MQLVPTCLQCVGIADVGRLSLLRGIPGVPVPVKYTRQLQGRAS